MSTGIVLLAMGKSTRMRDSICQLGAQLAAHIIAIIAGPSARVDMECRFRNGLFLLNFGFAHHLTNPVSFPHEETAQLAR